MSDFARQQGAFQRGILTGDNAILDEILDSPKAKRETLFGVYRHAYGSRLVEVMRNDHKLLHRYLGDEAFDEMGHAYVKARPSENPNLRWFSQGLPDFLRSAEPYNRHPVLSDLAALEKALNDAFDAAEAPVLALGDMAGFAPEIWNDLVFQAASERLSARSRDQCAGDLACTQERRDAAGRGRPGSALAPADLAAGHHADVPRACHRRGDDVGRGGGQNPRSACSARCSRPTTIPTARPRAAPPICMAGSPRDC